MSRKIKERSADYFKAFPRRLENLMKQNNITQQTLADELGVSRQSVSYYCNGQSSPDWETIVKIAGYFKVSSDYLLGLSEVDTPKTDIRATADLTGLSQNSVELLMGWRSSSRYVEHLNVLNFFFSDPRFILFIDRVIRYLDKANKLEEVRAKYNATNSYILKEASDDIVKEIELREGLKDTLSAKDLSAAEELKEGAFLYVHKAVDVLIDSLEYHNKRVVFGNESEVADGND